MVVEPDLTFYVNGAEAYTIKAAPSSIEDWANTVDGRTTAQVVAGAAIDGHLAGLFTVPNLIGDVKDNVLFGGGLAPTDVKYGSRAVSFVVYVTAGTRSAVVAELRRLNAILASGNIEMEAHGYGVCRAGYLAAPAAVEWLGNITNAVKVSFTLTFIDPKIYGLRCGTVKEVVKLFSGSMSARDDDAAFIGPWKPYEDPSGYDRYHTSFTVTNRGTTVAYPVVGVDLAAIPDDATHRSGFGIEKNSLPNHSFPEHAWYAFNKTLTGRVMYDTLQGQAYYMSGAKAGRYGNVLSTADGLELQPGETAEYYVAWIGDDLIGVPETQRDNKAALVFVWGNY